MPLTIAHIIHWPKSGIGTVVRQLIESDPSENFNYIVVFLESDSESVSQFSKLGAMVVETSISKRPIAAIRKIRHNLRKADIVHIHSFLPQLVSSLAARKGSKKIRTVHNPYPYFSAADVRAKIKRSLEGLLISSSKSDLVSVSNDTLSALPWRLPQGVVSTVIENGIAVDRPLSANAANAHIARPNGLLLIALGRLERQKGFDILLDAMALLNTIRPSDLPPITLWIIGEGSCRHDLERQAETLGLNNVTLVGYQTAPVNYLLTGDAFVLPSRFEGFALAALEAMALELPVILTEIGGIAGKLTHGENAHIVPKEDPKTLANALLTLLAHPEYRDKLAKNGKTFVETHFSIEKCVSKYMAIYLRAH